MYNSCKDLGCSAYPGRKCLSEEEAVGQDCLKDVLCRNDEGIFKFFFKKYITFEDFEALENAKNAKLLKIRKLVKLIIQFFFSFCSLSLQAPSRSIRLKNSKNISLKGKYCGIIIFRILAYYEMSNF